jgi:hypothetical protein
MTHQIYSNKQDFNEGNEWLAALDKLKTSPVKVSDDKKKVKIVSPKQTKAVSYGE